MTQYLFKNFDMLDPERDEVEGGHELLVEGEHIKEISAKPIKSKSASVVDCGKRTLMPGLIDSHVHVVLSEVSLPRLENIPLTLMTARAAVLMRNMLDRGFTSVRDTGGADWGSRKRPTSGCCRGLACSSPERRWARQVVTATAVAAPITALAATAAMPSILPWAWPTALPRCARPCGSRCARAATR